MKENASQHHHDDAHNAHPPAHEAGTKAPDHPEPPRGLDSEARGYRLELVDVSERALVFVIRAPGGEALRRFARVHDRELHLIMVSRDLTQYAHLHPYRDASGSWSVALPALDPGAYWVYADFALHDGQTLTLRRELRIGGRVPERAARAPSSSIDVDGLRVRFGGTLQGGVPGELTFHVLRGNAPVELEPYLGANGHLVVIRASDGAFLHAHPRMDQNAPGEVSFSVHPPSAGRYGLFLDFQTEGRVHTAAFAVDVAAESAVAHQ
jgi:hypothetical protein